MPKIKDFKDQYCKYLCFLLVDTYARCSPDVAFIIGETPSRAAHGPSNFVLRPRASPGSSALGKVLAVPGVVVLKG